jgi:hypothetical protein
MAKAEIPKLDWMERYKSLFEGIYAMMEADDDYVYNRWGEEEWLKFVQEARPRWSTAIAKRLIRKYGLKSDIEGALKLCGLYFQEVWGFGDPRFVDCNMESPTKGTWTNLVCRQWEKAKSKVPCDKACLWDWIGLIRALSPGIKVTMTKARPWGDDRCELCLEIEN